MLEGRALLATAGYDYVLSGLKWANPGHITYSIAPDGVIWDHGYNNLNATFNAKFGNAWQAQIARALATWESVANINISPVTESGQWDYNVAGQAQGDPRFGDIRFGGYDFQNNTTLAWSYSPPPQGLTAAGDVAINTAMPYNIGSDYDFYSVMLHETGLTLGLSEPPGPGVVMDTNYGGVRQGLMPGDIAGIQAIYGARTPDSYQAQGIGTSAGNAIVVSPHLGSGNQTVVGNVSLATIGDTEYFSVVVPPGAGGTLQVTAAAANISMLDPKVTVMDASGNVLQAAGNPSAWSANATVTLNQVVPGQKYVIAVTGATNNVFAVGAYQLQVAFPHAAVRSVPTPPAHPPTPTPTPAPITFPRPTPIARPKPQRPAPTTAPTSATFAQRLQAWLGYRQALLNRLHYSSVHSSVARAFRGRRWWG